MIRRRTADDCLIGMRIIIKTKDLTITPEIKNYLDKKLQSLQRFLNNFNQNLIIAEIEIGRATTRHQTGPFFRTEINFCLNGKMLRVEAKAGSLYAAIDEARDDLEREIKRFKKKKETIRIRGARSIKKKFNISPIARFRKGE